jgi:hypothetical protein
MPLRPECADECAALRDLEKVVNENVLPSLTKAIEGVGNFRVYQEESRANWADLKAERKLRKEAEEEAAKKKWKRSDKIAVVAILVVLLMPPIGWFTIRLGEFVSDVYQITKEWHELHKSQLPPKIGQGEPATARYAPPAQQAEGERNLP